MGWLEKVGNVQEAGKRTFPVAYTYTPLGGALVADLSGIWRDAYVEEDLGPLERGLVSQRPTLDVRLVDVGGSVSRTDVVVVTDPQTSLPRTFTIWDSQEDGFGMSKLLLEETT